METECEKIQRKLLDAPETQLTGEEIRHAKLCPSCGEAMENSFMVGGSLGAIARREGANKASRLPAELKLRVRDLLREELEREREAENRIETLTRKEQTRKEHRWGYYFGLPPWFWKGAKWSAAAAVLALVVLAGFEKWADRQPIGEVRFSAGSLDLTGLTGEPLVYKNLHAGNEKSFKRGAVIATNKDAPAIVNLGAWVDCIMEGSTKLALTDRDEIELKSGSIWLFVKKKGRGFRVKSPHGLVRVTGTSFGVSDKGIFTKIDVAEGVVLVKGGGKPAGAVTAGRMMDLGTWGVSTLVDTKRKEPSRHPNWVEGVLDAEWKANSGLGTSIPSLVNPNKNKAGATGAAGKPNTTGNTGPVNR